MNLSRGYLGATFMRLSTSLILLVPNIISRSYVLLLEDLLFVYRLIRSFEHLGRGYRCKIWLSFKILKTFELWD